MGAPVCRNGHRSVHCQRWRQRPWIWVNGLRRPQFRCPACGMFIFPSVQRRMPQAPRFWW